MELPFFDRRVVEAIIGRPVRPFLNHRFYNRWLMLFARAVTSVPWQGYPGHEGCPLGEGNALTYQWSEEFSQESRRLDRRKYLRSTWSALKAGRYAGTAVSPLRLSLALLATALGVRDLTYALKFSEIMAKR
jgi:asparagine synthase (glutamine-hydrolysing)